MRLNCVITGELISQRTTAVPYFNLQGQRPYRNIICRAIVPEENGTYRANGLIEESGIMGGEISNIITYNIHANITTDRNVGGNLSLSKGLLITDCKFYNAASGVVNNTWNSYIQNIELINTPEQSANFVLKDIPTIPEPYGMDCVLSSGSFTTYTNIRAINPIERCIYVQASHVYAEKSLFGQWGRIQVCGL